ncbi:MAG: peptide ABC transporter substrate-binding protein [Anaerolineae bacterium]|nr:peptide ABC transporter substrate-binding protein [Anaerolineae bacterium]
MRKFYVIAGLSIILSLVFSGCDALGGQPAELKTLHVNSGGAGDIPTIDPAIAEDVTAITVIESTFIGLTQINEVTSLLEPGMATEWDEVINADGTQTITFHLRDDVPWVQWNDTKVEIVKDCAGKDRMVTADDFAYGIYRNLLPANASPYGYLLSFVLKGAAEFNDGDTEDFSTVGVEVIDDTTIALTFLEPAAYNAQISGLWVARPQPKWVIDGDDCTEAQGEKWTEPGSFQSYGPYTMSEWLHDSSMTLVKNPFWPGTDSVPQAKIDIVEIAMLDPVPAFAEYEAGNIDAAAVPLADIDRVKADPELSKELVIAPNLCTYFYGFNTTAPVVEDVRVRRALSMAIDRQGLIDNVLKGEQEPAQWFARPGLAGAPTMDTHPDLGVKSDPEAAKALLDEYLEETGQKAEDLDLTLVFNTSADHQKIAEALQQMWADNLGVNVKLVNQEWAVFLETIKGAATPQIWRLGWCLDYPDANNFLREVCAANGSSNPYDEAGNPAGGFFWNNDEFEDLMKQAAIETDPDKRLEMYARAEEILVYEDAVMIPIYWYTRVTVTKPYIIRTFSVGGHELYYKWDITSE